MQDPTEGKFILLASDLEVDVSAHSSIPLNAPRSLAFAPDGTFYVADSRNHRVLHLDTQGDVLQEWGTFADGVSIPIGDGTFNEPWGLAVGPEGSVYVTDTWNHRIQKFDANGNFLFQVQDTATRDIYVRCLARRLPGRATLAGPTWGRLQIVTDADGEPITSLPATIKVGCRTSGSMKTLVHPAPASSWCIYPTREPAISWRSRRA